MDWRIYGEGRTQIPLISFATLDLLTEVGLNRVYTDIKMVTIFWVTANGAK